MSNRAGGPYDTIALLGARNREHILLAVIDLNGFAGGCLGMSRTIST